MKRIITLSFSVLAIILNILVLYHEESRYPLVERSAWATITSETTRIQYDCTGSTGPYAFSFKIFEGDDLAVIETDSAGTETDLTLTTDYSVSLTGTAPSAGTITLTSACTSGDTLTILRDVAFTQETDYIAGARFPADSHENALDKQVMLMQQLNEIMLRAPKVKRSSGLSDLQLPISASHVIGWDGDGETLTTYAVSGVTNAVTLEGSQTITGAKTFTTTTNFLNGITVPGDAGESNIYNALSVYGASTFYNGTTIYNGATVSGGLATNTVSEETSGVGVTVDGTLIKDGAVAAVRDQGLNAHVMHTAIQNIGGWNMDSDEYLNVSHSLGAAFANVSDVRVMILNDARNSRTPLDAGDAGVSVTMEGFVNDVTSTYFNLRRVAGSRYDGAAFANALIERGDVRYEWYTD